MLKPDPKTPSDPPVWAPSASLKNHLVSAGFIWRAAVVAAVWGCTLGSWLQKRIIFALIKPEVVIAS